MKIIQLIPCTIETVAIYYDRTHRPSTPHTHRESSIPGEPPMCIWRDRVHLWALVEDNSPSDRFIVPMILDPKGHQAEGFMTDPSKDDNCIGVVSVSSDYYADDNYWLSCAEDRERSKISKAKAKASAPPGPNLQLPPLPTMPGRGGR